MRGKFFLVIANIEGRRGLEIPRLHRCAVANQLCLHRHLAVVNFADIRKGQGTGAVRQQRIVLGIGDFDPDARGAAALLAQQRGVVAIHCGGGHLDVDVVQGGATVIDHQGERHLVGAVAGELLRGDTVAEIDDRRRVTLNADMGVAGRRYRYQMNIEIVGNTMFCI